MREKAAGDGVFFADEQNVTGMKIFGTGATLAWTEGVLFTDLLTSYPPPLNGTPERGQSLKNAAQ
jgi:hypothetical protein